jgi:hypothetical protein
MTKPDANEAREAQLKQIILMERWRSTPNALYREALGDKTASTGSQFGQKMIPAILAAEFPDAPTK